MRAQIGQRLDRLELARHRVGARLRLVDGVARLVELLLGLGQHLAELGELGLHRAEHLPDLGGAFFERERAKAHLQAVERGQQRGGTGQRDAVLALQRFHQARASQRLGVQPFGGHEQNRELGGVRRCHVLVADGLGLGAQSHLDRAAGGFGLGLVGALLRIEQPLVVFARKFRVDGQPQRRAIVAPTRQLDRELHTRAAAGHGLDIGRVLLGREHLFEQTGQLHLAKDAARFDVGQHPVERADVLGQALHFTQATVHLIEPISHLLETLAQPRFERGVQLLVHGGAHLLELELVALLQGGQPLLDAGLDFIEAPLVGLGHLAQLHAQRI